MSEPLSNTCFVWLTSRAQCYLKCFCNCFYYAIFYRVFISTCFLHRLAKTAFHTIFIEVRMTFTFDVFLNVLYPIVLSFIDMFAFIKTFIDHWCTTSLISIYAKAFGDIKYFITECFIKNFSRCQIFISVCKIIQIILKTSFTDSTFATNLSPANKNMFIISFCRELYEITLMQQSFLLRCSLKSLV